MAVIGLRHFPETNPAQAEGQYAALGEVNAPLLLVLRSVALRLVADDIQNCRRASLQSLWLIQDRGGPEARNDFVAQLAQPIALAGFDNRHFFKMRRSIEPIRRPPVVDNLLEHVLAQLRGLAYPLLAALRRTERNNAFHQVGLQLVISNIRCLHRGLERASDRG